ncbi:MAG: hypothetical protein LLG09_07660 [Negativicutes bacterium]|nr:hypothetical protein [Negativicutes bacterium]
MNWSRAKSVLIIIFILLNVVLGYFNYLRPYRVMEATMGDDAALAAIRDQLLQEKITLLQSIPHEVHKTGSLNLITATEMKQNTANLFSGLDSQTTACTIPNGLVYYTVTAGQEQAVLSACGLLTYTNGMAVIEANTPLISYEFACSVAKNFLHERLGYNISGYRLQTQKAANELGSSQKIIWCRSYEGYALYDVSLEMTVVGSRVASFTLNPYRITGETSPAQWTATAADILLRLPEDEYIRNLRDQALAAGENWLVIKEIEFGYFSFFSSAESGAAQPVWRVLLQDNREIYFDAFTAQRLFYR